MKNFRSSFAESKTSTVFEAGKSAARSSLRNNLPHMNLLDFFDTDLPIDRKSFVYRVLFLLLVLA